MFNCIKRLFTPNRDKEPTEIEQLRTRSEFLDSKMRKFQVEIFDKHPIGSEFQFMGITIRVTGHRSFEPGGKIRGFGPPPAPMIHPEVECNYVDNRGIIQEICFTLREMDLTLDKPHS